MQDTKALTVIIKICSDNKIRSEFEQNKIFWGNGYPEEVIVDTMNKTVNKIWNNIRPFGPSNYILFSKTNTFVLFSIF